MEHVPAVVFDTPSGMTFGRAIEEAKREGSKFVLFNRELYYAVTGKLVGDDASLPRPAHHEELLAAVRKTLEISEKARHEVKALADMIRPPRFA